MRTKNVRISFSPNASAVWIVETGGQWRQFADREQARAWQLTQPPGSSMYLTEAPAT